MSSKLKDLGGQKFGKWNVIRRIKCDRNATMWECRCDCGKEKIVYGWHLTEGNSKSCGCDKPKKSSHHQWTGVGEISGNFWDSIIRGANGTKGKRVAIDFSITKEYVWDLFLKQNRKCALSGIDLIMNYGSKWGEIHTASLDRIDSNQGYIEGNIQWVHKDINMMKRVYDENYFIELCIKVADFYREVRTVT